VSAPGDPVEIVAPKLPTAHNEAWAREILTALHDAGWRLVRVADAWPGDNGGTAMLVDEEWTP